MGNKEKALTPPMILLQHERKKVSFPVEKLTNLLDGGEGRSKERRQIEELLLSDPKLASPPFACMTREERFVESMKRTVYFMKNFCKRHGWSVDDHRQLYLDRISPGEISMPIHRGVFIPCITSFGSPEQIEKWYPLAAELYIVGTYAQTELGHGTFLRGLETTATYDATTEEFIMDSPTITASKWWPGDLGKVANHALVMANLVVDGKNHGMHPFIVQIRDLSTHLPLPGVQVGDIGDKLAFENIDNGFLHMTNLRIPRENLLCKNAEVRPDGTYVTKTDKLMTYGSMVRLRVIMLKVVILSALAKACTVAVRYSTVRCQGRLTQRSNNSVPEIAVMEYVTQQHKVLPQVAKQYAMVFAANQLLEFYNDALKEFEAGDLSKLPQLHGLSAGMKAFVTEEASTGIEILRRSCGGHGYANSSGLPHMYRNVVAGCTYEGENTVMYLQSAGVLIKSIMENDTSELTAYLDGLMAGEEFPLPSMDLNSLEYLVKCFQKRSRFCLHSVAMKLQSLLGEGMRQADALNVMSVQLVNTAKAHIQQHIVSSFAAELQKHNGSPLQSVLTDVFMLHALHGINENLAEFIMSCDLTKDDATAIFQAEMSQLAKLRDNAVGLVDAYDYRDVALQSCLGAYDGNVYERLFEYAKNTPFNSTEVHEPTYEILKPYLHTGRDLLQKSSNL